MFVLFGGSPHSRGDFENFKRAIGSRYEGAIACAMTEIGETDAPFLRIDGEPRLAGDPEELLDLEEGERKRRKKIVCYEILGLFWTLVRKSHAPEFVLIESAGSQVSPLQHLPFDHQMKAAA